MIKYLFEPLSLAATFTIGASLILALTVVPAFCATFIRDRVREQSDDTIGRAANAYSSWLGKLLKVPALSVMVIVLTVGASFLLLPMIGSELFPEVDAGTFELRIKTLPGTDLNETEKLVARIEETIKEVIRKMKSRP